MRGKVENNVNLGWSERYLEFFQVSWWALFSSYLIWNFGCTGGLLSPAPPPALSRSSSLAKGLQGKSSDWFALSIPPVGICLFSYYFRDTDCLRKELNLLDGRVIYHRLLLWQLAIPGPPICRYNIWQDLGVPSSSPGQQLSLCGCRPGGFCGPSLSLSAGCRNACLCLFPWLLPLPASRQSCWDDRSKWEWLESNRVSAESWLFYFQGTTWFQVTDLRWDSGSL